MHVQNLPPLLQRHLVGHRGAGDARTVDQAMHGSETRLRPLDHVRRKGGIGHIAGQGEAALFTDRLARPRQRVRIHVDKHRVPAKVRHEMGRSEEHTSELQSLMRISYAVFCLKKKKTQVYNTKTE